MCHTIKILNSNWPRRLKFSQFSQAGRHTSCFWLFSPRSCVGHALRPILCSDWSKFARWVHGEYLCIILKLVYFDRWSWQSFVSTFDVFNCLFPLNVQNQIQLLSRVFCYSWLVCLLGWFLVEKYVACQSRKSNFRWHRFRFSPCLMHKRVEKSEAILALLDSFQCISYGKPE